MRRRFLYELRRIPNALIAVYQCAVSPFFPPACRFYPSCSTYARQAVGKYGILKGGALFLKRLLRCHPFHPGGYDPLE